MVFEGDGWKGDGWKGTAVSRLFWFWGHDRNRKKTNIVISNKIPLGTDFWTFPRKHASCAQSVWD